MYDAIIVGASVAGASAAALLGQRGFRVLLLDRAVFPRPKVCGEGLMPAGVRILEDLGLASQVRQAGAVPFTGLRFHLSRGEALDLDFQELDRAAHGLALARESLDQILLRNASATTGVEVREGFNVTGFRAGRERIEAWGNQGGIEEVFAGRALIAADGIRSRFPARLGIRRTRPRPGRFALRASFEELRGLSGPVEVFCAPKAEAYIAPMGEGRARITLLLDGVAAGDTRQARQLYFQNLARFPELTARMNCPHPLGSVEATSPVSQKLSRCHSERLLLAGDAAGASDPVTGQGMTVALRDALLISEFLPPLLACNRLGSADLAPYTEQRNQHFAPSCDLAQNLLFVLRHEFLAHQAARAVSRNSQLRHRLLALATESRPQKPLTHLEQLRLLFGF